LIFAFVCFCPKRVEALSCAIQFTWRNFDRIDGDADLVKRKQDAEARGALAMLKPIIFRGRVARVRDLTDRSTTDVPVSLVIFRDVEVLKGELPQSADDRKAFIVHYQWCDARCGPASQTWPRGQTFAFGVRPFRGEAVTDTFGKKVVYKGRVDAVMGACDRSFLTPLELKLLDAPADEIARLKREYPFHAIRKDPPPGSD
jgi:hypothetical protein